MCTRSVPITMCVALALSGCAGKEANPVAQYQPGDEKRSCAGLKGEIAQNEVEIARLLPDKDATGYNVAMGVAGAFLIVPWFFMDLKDGEAIEIKSLERRNQWLREVASEKDCSVAASKFKFEAKPRPASAEQEGPPPKCKDVGGYEAYLKETGRVCQL